MTFRNGQEPKSLTELVFNCKGFPTDKEVVWRCQSVLLRALGVKLGEQACNTEWQCCMQPPRHRDKFPDRSAPVTARRSGPLSSVPSGATLPPSTAGEGFASVVRMQVRVGGLLKA